MLNPFLWTNIINYNNKHLNLKTVSVTNTEREKKNLQHKTLSSQFAGFVQWKLTLIKYIYIFDGFDLFTQFLTAQQTRSNSSMFLFVCVVCIFHHPIRYLYLYAQSSTPNTQRPQNELFEYRSSTSSSHIIFGEAFYFRLLLRFGYVHRKRYLNYPIHANMMLVLPHTHTHIRSHRARSVCLVESSFLLFVLLWSQMIVESTNYCARHSFLHVFSFAATW